MDKKIMDLISPIPIGSDGVVRPWSRTVHIPSAITVSSIATLDAAFTVQVDFGDDIRGNCTFVLDTKATRQLELLGTQWEVRPYLRSVVEALDRHLDNAGPVAPLRRHPPRPTLDAMLNIPWVERVMVLGVAEVAPSTWEARLDFDGEDGRVVLKFDDDTFTYELLEWDSRLEFSEGSQLQHLLARIQLGEAMDFPLWVEPFRLSDDPVAEPKLGEIERIAEPTIVRFDFCGVPGAFVEKLEQKPDGVLTHSIHTNQHVARTRYKYALGDMIAKYLSGDRVALPQVLPSPGI